MARVTARPLADRLGAVAADCDDVPALAAAVFAAITRDVPFAFACLATTDPASGLITGAFKSHPLPLGDEAFAASEYGAPDLNQFVELARRPVPVGVLSVDTDGQPDRCRRLHDYMTPVFGFTDELRLVCCSRNTTWGLLALYRGAGEPAFTAADGRLVASAGEVIAHGVRHALFADRSPGAGAVRVPVVVIVDANNHMTDMTAAAHELIDELGGWDNGALPASILAVATSARSSNALATAQVPAHSRGWLTLRALTLDGPTTGRSVVLTIDTAPQAAVGQLTIAACGLTAREQEVAELVLQGASTKTIAAELFLSPHTVQDHLKAVFGKLGVSSRREMLAQFVLPTS